MAELRLNTALDRIETALGRLEARPVVDARRHERLRAAIAAAMAGMDRLIADEAK